MQLKEIDVKIRELAPQESLIAQRKNQASEEARGIRNELMGTEPLLFLLLRKKEFE